MAYPDEIDDIETTPAGSTALGAADPTHTEHHQQLHAAIDSIAAVLGDAPDLGHGTVEDALEYYSTSTPWEEQTDSFTLAAAQAGKSIRCNKGSTLTVTVPANASVPIATDASFRFVQWGAGTVEFAEGSGSVEVYAEDGRISVAGLHDIAARYQSVVLEKVDTNVWLLTGSLA